MIRKITIFYQIYAAAVLRSSHATSHVRLLAASTLFNMSFEACVNAWAQWERRALSHRLVLPQLLPVFFCRRRRHARCQWEDQAVGQCPALPLRPRIDTSLKWQVEQC